MKKILITGEGSYIGTSFENWLKQWPEQYAVCTVGTMHDEWRAFSFAGFDAVLHVAGIAHVSADPKMEGLYYKVNRDLAIDVAKKAKSVGIKQFTFMSSMTIYGDDGRIGEKLVITKDTVPQPENSYGRSKLEADLVIQKMADDKFKPIIIRTPMVYGQGCKGNFPKLVKLAKVCPVFPDIENERSMIYIDNLCEFLRLCVNNEVTGVFFPQNKEYVSTKEIINIAAECMGKRVYFVKWFNPVLRLLSKRIGFVNKVFGNKVYERGLMEGLTYNYCVNSFHESIKESIRGGVKKSLMIASVASIIDQFNMPNINLLQQMGYEVTVAANFTFGNTSSKERTDAFKKQLMSIGVRTYDFLFNRNVFCFRNVKIYKQLKMLIEKENFDLIHCHSPIGGVLTRLASRNAHKNGVKVIYTAHGFHFFNGASLLNWLIYYPIEKWLARYTDVLITINHEDYARAQKFKLRNGGKVYYIPGIGVDTHKYANVMVDKVQKRSEIGVPEDVFMILSVGELIKRKNHEAVIRAVAKLKRKDLYYTICGIGKLEDYLKKLCHKLGIADKVIFLGFRMDIAEICKTADMFVFPSFQEGLSIALMEAMAAHLPVVCSEIRGNVDLVENGKGGEFIKPGDVNGFAKGMEKLINDAYLRGQMGVCNAEATKLYDIAVVNSEMEKIYKECL